MSVNAEIGVAAEIRARLEAAFRADRLEIINESHLHGGHAGDDGSGESHFRLVIRAAEFVPMSRVARHRAVNAALGDLTRRVQAMALDIG